MSVSILANNTERKPAFQPFQCSICQSRFTRHENLKRHAAVHSRSQDETALACDVCHATFSRPDLRLRHLKRKHPEHHEPRPSKRHATSTAGERRPQGAASPSASPPDSRRDSHLQKSGYDDDDPCGESWPTPMQNEKSWPKSDFHSEHFPEHTSSHGSVSRTVRGYEHIGTDISTHHTSTVSSTGFHSISPTANELEPSSLLLATMLGSSGSSKDHEFVAATPHLTYHTSPANFNFDQWSPDRLLPIDVSQVQSDWTPSVMQTTRGCELFFAHISDFLPFLHQMTFEATQVSMSLLLGMLCLAYQYGEDPDCDNDAGSGSSLSRRCFRQARILIAAEEECVDGSHCDISMVQAYLLLQTFAMMYSSADDSAYGLKTHSKMISVARASGLMHPLPSTANTTECLDSLWQQFVQAESRKRTVYAVHQIDTLWYQFLSIPRSLSHLEIKHDLPCPDYFWTASSSGEWAHRQLIARQSSPTIQYQDAVRCILSSNRDLSTIPAFDPYGTINITQFLVSSAREISGWSTMTGMLSMERLEPLRLSLLALSPLVHSQSETAKATHASLCEATWETAMIEMQMWSPSHTGGIVGGSMDAALHQLVYLAPSLEFLRESNLAKSVQPHVDWFLRYLDETFVPDCEAPWITLYACKAFMIAWQLVRGGVAGAMQIVGVSDGDVEGALTWAKTVFRRREQWKLGKIVIACLDGLEI